MDSTTSSPPWSMNAQEVLNLGKRRNYSASGIHRIIHASHSGIRIITMEDNVAVVLEACPIVNTHGSWSCAVWVFNTTSDDEMSMSLAAEVTVQTTDPTSQTIFDGPYRDVLMQADYQPESPLKKALLVLDTFSIYMAKQHGRYEFRRRHELT